MKRNMGTIDKLIRVIAAIAILLLYLSDQISGVAAIILLVFASVFILTSFISFCPLYLPFGLSTRKKDK